MRAIYLATADFHQDLCGLDETTHSISMIVTTVHLGDSALAIDTSKTASIRGAVAVEAPSVARLSGTAGLAGDLGHVSG